MAYSPIDKPNQYFNPVIYSGNDVDGRAITTGFQTDWTWIKRRNGTNSHIISDIVRGATWKLDSSSNSLEVNNYDGGHLESFTSTGFTLGAGSINSGHTNATGGTYVSWNWKKSATPGFDIVTATGTGSAKTIAHSLSAVPQVIISKEKSGSINDWVMYHESLGNNKKMVLNETNAVSTDSCWNNTTPTSSVFSVSGASVVNRNSSTYVYYLFSEKKGYSKFSSYIGNGNADGTFIYTGFKPAFLMYKQSSASGESWIMHDNARNLFNVTNKRLLANASNAEADEPIDFLSNGFKCRTSGAFQNGSGSTYIYMAFAENPLVASNYVPTTAR